MSQNATAADIVLKVVGEENMNIFKELLNKLGIKQENGKVSDAEVLNMIFDSDMENLKKTKEEMDKAAFEMVVDLIDKANTIYILGIRNCEPLANFLGFYLNMMFDNVKLLTTNSTSEVFEQMVRIGSKDVMIGISFPRYSMRTLKAMEFANSRSAKVVAITDTNTSPMTLYSSCNLLAKSEMASVIDSLTAPLAVVNGLIAALAMRHSQDMSEYLETLDKVWEDYQIYNSDEMNQAKEQIEIYQRADSEEQQINE